MSKKLATCLFTREDPLDVSFSGSGFLSVYQLGVAQCLLEVAPHVMKEAPKVFGASAGSLVAAAVVCGSNLESVRDDIVAFARLLNRHFLGPLHPSVDVFKWMNNLLHSRLPENAHLLANGRLHVAMTRMSDGRNVILSNFHSRDELIQVLLCSCYVPILCGMNPPRYQGVHYLDGGFTNMQPYWDPFRTLTISPFPGESDLCPLDQSADSYSLVVSGFAFQLTWSNCIRVKRSLFPAMGETLMKEFENGYQDTASYLQNSAFQHAGLFSLEWDSVENPHTLFGDKEDNTAPVREHSENFFSFLVLLEQALYLGLPTWLQAGLPTPCSEHFLLRVISYLLLPYTLLTWGILATSYRFFLWLKSFSERIVWHYLKRVTFFVVNIFIFSLSKNIADGILPSMNHVPGMKLLAVYKGPSDSTQAPLCSTLQIQLCSSSNTGPVNEAGGTEPGPLPVSLLLVLEIEKGA